MAQERNPQDVYASLPPTMPHPPLLPALTPGRRLPFATRAGLHSPAAPRVTSVTIRGQRTEISPAEASESNCQKSCDKGIPNTDSSLPPREQSCDFTLTEPCFRCSFEAGMLQSGSDTSRQAGTVVPTLSNGPGAALAASCQPVCFTPRWCESSSDL